MFPKSILMKNVLMIFLLCCAMSFFTGCETEDVEPTGGLANSLASLSASGQSFFEDGGKVTLTATLSIPSSSDAVIELDFAGTAELNTDFSAAIRIEIPAGQTTGSTDIAAIQDTLEEGNESIIVSISSVLGAGEDGEQELTLTIEDDDVQLQAALIVNEMLYDPWNIGLDGDANGDGKYAQNEDEFIEFVNLSSQPLDMSGYEIYDTENLAIGTPNHKIPDGTIIQPGKAFVVFGGGTPTGSFGGATVQTSTFGDLNLNNAGDEMTLKDKDGNVILTFDIEPLSNNPNESYTRNPDITGEFEQHGANTTRLFSPGTKVDGTPF